MLEKSVNAEQQGEGQILEEGKEEMKNIDAVKNNIRLMSTKQLAKMLVKRENIEFRDKDGCYVEHETFFASDGTEPDTEEQALSYEEKWLESEKGTLPEIDWNTKWWQ